jgi:hypothetical protein
MWGAVRVDNRRTNARNGPVEKKLVYRKIPEQIPVQKNVALWNSRRNLGSCQ